MARRKMHLDEVDTDVSLVERLVSAQFPQWAGLPIVPVESDGTVNALYRLGDHLCVRLPRREPEPGKIEKEHRWLPILAPELPLAIPAPEALGAPGAGYAWNWSVYGWIDGETLTPGRLADPGRTAADLVAFIDAFHEIDPATGPLPGVHNGFRGASLRLRDSPIRAAITQLEGMIDTEAATRAWEAALEAPEWSRPPVWVHGDLLPGNLLARDGRLRAVIDFGSLGVGDPACDLMPAWTLFSAQARAEFRAGLSVEDTTWARGRGWALSFGLLALPYYAVSNPGFAAIARFAIDEVLADAPA